MNSVSQISHKLSPVGAPRLGILLLHITILRVWSCNLPLLQPCYNHTFVKMLFQHTATRYLYEELHLSFVLGSV
jgi:hypothetical protein